MIVVLDSKMIKCNNRFALAGLWKQQKAGELRLFRGQWINEKAADMECAAVV